MDMFKQEDVMIYSEEETSTRQTYDEVVKDLIMDEKQYLRDLHMITKVSHRPWQKKLVVGGKVKKLQILH